VQEEDKLSLKVFVMERLFVSGLGGITDTEMFFSPWNRLQNCMCIRKTVGDA